MKRHQSLSEVFQAKQVRAYRRAIRGAWGVRVCGFGERTTASHRQVGRKSNSARRGSTLLVVMALLGMLTLLGLLYFTFANQEKQNAENFAEAVKHVDDPGDDIDAIFDAMLDQLIQGASIDKKNSVFAGGRHSIAYNMLGHDLQPFNGVGVRVHRTASGALVVDQDRDGVADPDQSLLGLNDSAAAQRFPPPFTQLQWPPIERRVETLPAPDVDYTYPDNNNMFLAYIGRTWKTPAGATATGYPVIKPSFHRPEFLRDDNGQRIADWATHQAGGGTAPFSTGPRLFRPHPDHIYVPRGDQNINAPIRRFLNDYDPADVADIASLGPFFAPSAPRGFPFKKVPPIPAPVPGSAPNREQGVWSLIALPPNPPFTFPAHDFDVDNDNDGTADSIWMDLDLPILVRSSDNATYVPLVALMIQDLDSLLNLNGIGNLSGDTVTNVTTNFGNGQDIHRSAMGLSTSEVSPFWALDTRPSEAASVSDHTTYFHAPTTIRHLANMEWWWFNKGRVQFTTPRQIFAGRYGEADRIWQVLATGTPPISVQVTNSILFPYPGIWDKDDNRNGNEGGPLTRAVIQITSGGDENPVLGGQQLPFGHPLALNGLGRYWAAANPKLLSLFLPPTFAPTDPNRWLQYTGMGTGYDGTSTTGNVGWFNPFGGTLMANSFVGVNHFIPGSPPALFDDPNEMTLVKKYLQRPYDEPLDPIDTLALFLSPSDRAKVGLTSRLEQLMPGNFTPTSGSNFYQVEVGRRFTTESWDVKQFALPRFIGGLGADGAPGIAGVDDNRDGVPDDANERGWPGSDDDRGWEYNVDIDGNGKLEFPPQFNPAADFQPRIDPAAADYRPENAYGPNDPFRPQLRRLLSVEFGNTTAPRTPMRLSINQFLDVEHRAGNVSNPYTDPLGYRPLTAHSQDSTLTTVPPASPLPAYPPTNEGEREFWARRDRQQMARDIYVLLYTFCGGNDAINVTAAPGNTAYHGKVRRQMAQFAVNMVDALDRDNVITAFEYDDNLQDGWNLDDDFTTNDAGTLPATSQRFVVFGTEAQELTISEALWAHQASDTTNVTLTPFDETTGNHHFLQVELRNISPLPVDLWDPVGSTALNRSIWRVVRDDNGNGVMDSNENAAQFVNGTFTLVASGPTAPPPNPITPGSLFTFASADASPVGAASLYVDTAAGAGEEIQAPSVAGATYPAAPGFANLDMNHASHASYVLYEQAGSVPGDLLSRNFEPTATTTSTTVRLQRRLNPKLIGLTPGLNPFHTVDQFRVRRSDLNLTSTDTAATAATKLGNIRSQERQQPLNGASAAASAGTTATDLKNTLLSNNSNSPPFFNLFQPHFDRDFASVVELFDIPLEGPEQLTRLIPDSRRPPNLIDASDNLVGQLENRGPWTFGAAVLMQSEDRDGDGNLLSVSDDGNNNGVQDGAETDTNGNGFFDFGEDFNRNGVLDAHPYHFHRLLSLVEVPTRTHQQLGNPLFVNQVPARINLNGVRDPRVLGGLIDSGDIMGRPERTGVDLDGDGQIEPGLQDLLGDAVEDPSGTPVLRDWWFQFLVARDGLDETTSLPLPISGFSRPFRDLGYLRYDTEFDAQSSVEDTILRELPGGLKYTGGVGGAKGKGKGKAKGKTGGGKGAQGPADGRRLFELATEAEFNQTNVLARLEPMMRYRLLSKIIGNTTTRSNVFVVHATIGMFAAKEYPNGAVRIGGQMDVDRDGAPDAHRAVFIIDRSNIEEAYDKGSRTFDWKKLVTARQRIN